jgi:HEAT repeat protein
MLAALGIAFIANGGQSKDTINRGALRDLRTKAEVDSLVAALSSDDPVRRVNALTKGTGIMRKDFKAAVIACTRHPDPRVRQAALDVVLPSCISAGYETLARSLADRFPGKDRSRMHCIPEGEGELRYAGGPVARTLRRLGEAAIPVLLEKLNSESADVRQAAVTVLGQIGSRRAVPGLVGMLGDPEPRVQLRAIRALGVLGGKRALDAVAAMTGDADEATQRALAIALARNDDGRAITVWSALLRRAKERYAAHSLGPWLRSFPRKKVIPLLLEGLSHRESHVRYDCHETLKALTRQDFGYVAGFRHGVKSTEAERNKAIARWEAWWARAQDQEPYEWLLAALHSTSARTRGQALHDLAMLGDRRAIPGLLGRYHDKNTRVDTTNERGDVPWALRILSARAFDDKASWRRWWAGNKDRPGGFSPLVVPFRPLRLAAKVDIGGTAEHVSIDGHLAFVGTRSALEIYDVSQLPEAEIIGHYAVGFQGVEQLHAQGGRLFLTTHTGGLHVYRYTAAGDMVHVSSHPEVKWGGHFLIGQNRLLVGNHRNVALYETSRDGPPRLLDKRAFQQLRSCSYSGEEGFFTTADWSGKSISIGASFPIGRVWPDGTALAAGERFYCLDHGVLIVRRLRTGQLLGKAPARARYNARLLVDGTRVYALLDEMGIVIYDASDPTNIEVLSHTPLPGGRRRTYRGFSLSGGYLFCADYSGELRVFDVPAQFTDRIR